MDISIIVLSAGAGTRMKSSTPKVLHKISGKETIYYVIKEAKKITNNVNIVLYHEAEAIKKVIFKYFDDIEITIQDLKNYPGTAGALKNINFNSERILVLNGDMPLIEASELKSFLKMRADIVMSVIKLENPNGYGRVLIENEEVKKIVEQKDANTDELKIQNVNSGVYLFKREILNQYLSKITNKNAQNEYYLTDIIELCVKDNKIIKPIFVKEENFKGVNSKFDLANAETLMQSKIKEKFMLNGVTMRMPESIYIESDVEIEGECIIENGVSLLGKTKICSSHIKTNTIIEDSQILNSTLGPMARVRPETILNECVIGNFVEIKKSNLVGVKAGHLSYIGDSQIGENTNIGAGVITCNYDGKTKHKTIIGKNVFVGSDSQLIAPIKIEDNTIIGAGTTLTNDVKEGELAISRIRQTNIKGFFKRFFGD